MAWFSPQAPLIPDIITLNATSLNRKDAIVCDGETRSWAEFGEGTARVANALLGTGLVHGDRVVVLMSNSYEMLEVMFGIIRAGLVTVPLNVAISDPAIAGMITNCGARAVFASDDHVARIEALRDQIADAIGDRFIGVSTGKAGWLDYHQMRGASNATLPAITIRPDDVCNIIYSSGTTGLPKGIIHDHACRSAWGSDMAIALRYHSAARTLCNLGLYSNISWVAMLATLFVGGTIVVQRRFDPAACLAAIEREEITHTAMVPLQFQKLLECDEFDSFDLSSLDSYMCCGSPLAVALKQQIIARMPGDLIELYGLTEGLVTILSPEDSIAKIESVGKACPGQHLAILDHDDKIVPAGSAGEIVGYSRFLMAGYFANDLANEEATWVHPSGQRWLRTGDIGMFDDDGFLYLVDRKKDMILSGAQNIYPADIEATMIEHEAVSEIAVIGVASKRWGETPLAIVVCNVGASISPDELTAWANSKLGKQQRIAGSVFVESLPRNPNGKVLKRELRKQYAESEFE